MQSQRQAQGSSALNTLRDHYPSHPSIVPEKSTGVRVGPPGSTPYVSKDVMEQFIRQSSVENTVRTQNTVDVRREGERTTNVSSGWYELCSL